jgi:putative membrane protein
MRGSCRIGFSMLLVVTMAVTMAACSREHGPTTGAEKATDPPRTRESPRLSDAQIMGALAAANQGEVEFSQKDIARAGDATVKAFAEKMVQHHGDALTRLQAASRDARLELAKSRVTERLEADVARERTGLDARTGDAASADLAFMCAQLRLHEGVLDTITTELAPAAQDEHVKAQLSATRPVVAAHLDEVRGIVQKLSGQSPEAACRPQRT